MYLLSEEQGVDENNNYDVVHAYGYCDDQTINGDEETHLDERLGRPLTVVPDECADNFGRRYKLRKRNHLPLWRTHKHVSTTTARALFLYQKIALYFNYVEINEILLAGDCFFRL